MSVLMSVGGGEGGIVSQMMTIAEVICDRTVSWWGQMRAETYGDAMEENNQYEDVYDDDDAEDDDDDDDDIDDGGGTNEGGNVGAESETHLLET